MQVSGDTHVSRTAGTRRNSYDFAYLIGLHFHLGLNLTIAVGSDTTTFRHE